MTEKPLPLQLADAICDYSRRGHETEDQAKLRRMRAHKEAATELRRLHAEVERLEAAAPQPAVPSEPLTKKQIEQIEQAYNADPAYKWDTWHVEPYTAGFRAAERAHGIAAPKGDKP